MFSHVRCFRVISNAWAFFGVCRTWLPPNWRKSIVFNDETLREVKEGSQKKASTLDTSKYSGGWMTGNPPEKLFKKFRKCILEAENLSYRKQKDERSYNSLGSPFQTLPASCFKRPLQPTDLHFDPPAVFHQCSKHFFGKNLRCSMPNS